MESYAYTGARSPSPSPTHFRVPSKNVRAIVDGMEIRAKVVRRTDRGR
jgi:hypothetical protein